MHPMVTRAKADIFKPLKCMNCHVTTTSPLPLSHIHALRDSNWKEAMLDEYNALVTNGTWVLVPRPANVDVVRSMWLFKHKFHAYGSLSSSYATLQSVQNSVDIESKIGPKGDLVADPTLYCSLVGALQNLTFTCPNLSYAIQQVVRLLASLPMDIVYILEIIFYLGLLNDMLLLSHSSVEAEYHGVANVHQRTKHIEIDIHFVHVYVASGQVRVLHVPSRFQYADIFKKRLPTALFLEFRSSLNV
ncbi:ribonuclease H-like domain-containing protein [Tanacetum coccineum]